MKIFIKDDIVNKSISNAFDIMFNLDNNIISSTVSNFVDYQKIDWYNKKKVIQKKEYMTVYISALPVVYANFINHDLKYMNIYKVIKHTFKNDSKYYIYVKCKIKNVIPISSVKCICKVKLHKVSTNQTKISIKAKTSTALPYAADIEEYINGYVNTIYNKIMNVLQT